MAVQGQDKGSLFCDKCFTNVPKESEFCPNCGAPLNARPGHDGTDPTVYPKLAEANLLRMRKQYKNAEDVCLSILRQFPNNIAANVLLGDIAAERGDIAQAAEWYELALDIDTQAPNVQEKLNAVREKREHEEVATTAEQLGLPVEKPKTALIAAIAIAAILIVGVLAYWAYRTSQQGSSTPQNQVDKPVVVGNTPPPVPPEKTTSGTTGSTGNQDQPPTTKDAELKKVLGSNLTDKDYLLNAWYDQALNGITVTYMAASDKDVRALGANIAIDAFGILKDKLDRTIDQVQIKAVKDSEVVYSAIVKRSDYETTQTKEWQEAHKDDKEKALLNVLLTNEWHPEAPSDTGGTGGKANTSSTTGSEGDTAGSSGTTTTGGTSSTTGTSSGSTSATSGAGTKTGTTAGGE